MLNVNGTMHKAVKCPLLGFFKMNILNSGPDECISIIVNMGLICRKATPASEIRRLKRGIATTTREKLPG